MDRRSFLGTSGTVLAVMPALAISAHAEDAAEGKSSQGGADKSSHVFVFIEIQAVSGMEDKIRDTFVNTIKTSHKPGILNAQIFEHAGEPGRFYSLQEWESEAAFREHMSGSSEGLDTHLKMMKGMPSLTILKSLGDASWTK